MVIKLDATSQQAFIKEMHRPAFLTALNKLHRNPGSLWTITSDAFPLTHVYFAHHRVTDCSREKGIVGHRRNSNDNRNFNTYIDLLDVV